MRNEDIKVHTLKGRTISLKNFLKENENLLNEEEEEYKLEE